MVGPPFNIVVEWRSVIAAMGDSMSHEILVSPQFQMSLLLMTALGGYMLASRIGQSAVIGEILVGILVGPSFLNLLGYTTFVQELANLGAIILLFVIGLEFELKDIMRPRYLLIAACGVVVPWIGGFALMELLGYGTLEAVFTGTALTATSIAITANVLREMGKLGTETAKAIIGAAVLDDILGLIVLSATVSLSSGHFDASGIAILLGKTLLFIFGGGALGLLVFRRFITYIDASRLCRQHGETPFILSMAIAFGYAAIAEWIGLSAIVGAFLAGACLGSVTLKNGKDYREGSEYLRIIFSSVFFISLGVIADLRTMSASIAVLIIALTIVAMLTKVIGCGIPALACGMPGRDAAAIGMGMVPRGEVAMIVALLGLEKGIIRQDVYVAIILMSLLTTIAVPPFLRKLMTTRVDRGHP